MPESSALCRVIRSPLSIAGMVLTTISAVLFLVVFLADLFGLHTNPYLGIVFFLILPGIFLFGLLLIPLGAWIERRRRAAGKQPSELHWPRIDLNDPVQRRAAVVVFALTMANIVIVSLAAYRGVEYMDSVQFCGQVCHTVMKPEVDRAIRTARTRASPACSATSAPARRGSRKSKISGTRQVLAVTLQHLLAADSVAGAEPAPRARHVRAVPLAGEVPRRQDPAHRRVRRRREEHRVGDDAAGARRRRQRAARASPPGIHWHMNVANEVEYIATDDKRQVIPWVRVKDRFGNVREYIAEGVTPDQLANGRAPPDGLHGLPQSSEPSDGGDARAGGQRRDGARRDSREPAVRPPRGGESAQGDLSRPRRRRRKGLRRRCASSIAGRMTPIYMSQRQDVEKAVAGDAAGLPPQRLSGDERAVRHLSQQHRPHGLSRLLPLPRRQPQVEGRQGRSARTARPATRLNSRARVLIGTSRPPNTVVRIAQALALGGGDPAMFAGNLTALIGSLTIMNVTQ